MNKDSWERRLAVAWSSLDDVGGAEFVELIGSLAAELPAGSARADFEQACAFDSTGHPEKAVPLYQAALAKGDGLTDEQRRRSVIQMASSVRNLGRPDESVRLLRTELARGSDHLDDAVRGHAPSKEPLQP